MEPLAWHARLAPIDEVGHGLEVGGILLGQLCTLRRHRRLLCLDLGLL
jgi:hypothetical protein